MTSDESRENEPIDRVESSLRGARGVVAGRAEAMAATSVQRARFGGRHEAPSMWTDCGRREERCRGLRGILLQIASPPSRADEPAFYALLSQILSLCTPRPISEAAAELRVLAYAMHPRLHDDPSALDAFFRIAERCGSTGVFAGFAYLQMGYDWSDMKSYERALACFDAARPEELNPYFGGFVLDGRLGCLVRLGRVGQSVRALRDYLDHYQAYGDQVEDSLWLPNALAATPDALEGADPEAIALLRALSRFGGFRFGADDRE